MKNRKQYRMHVLYNLGEYCGISHYRGRMPSEALNKYGSCSSVFCTSNRDLYHAWRATDIIIINYITTSIYNILHVRRKANLGPYIIDIDDRLDCIDPLNPAYQYYGTEEGGYIGHDGKPITVWHDKLTFDITENKKRLEKVFGVIRAADGVTVTTNTLRDWILDYNKNVYVLPNIIDFSLWRRLPLLRDENEVRIGWYGGASHYRDLYMLVDPALPQNHQVIREITRRYPQVKWVLCGFNPQSIFGDIPKERIEVYEWVDPSAHAIQQSTINLDIGLCPLDDIEFNDYKSPLKWEEYAALRVPTVASNRLPYSKEIEHGKNGMLASRPSEWIDCISELIEDKSKRIAMGEAAYDSAVSKYSGEVVIPSYEAWLRTVMQSYWDSRGHKAFSVCRIMPGFKSHLCPVGV